VHGVAARSTMGVHGVAARSTMGVHGVAARSTMGVHGVAAHCSRICSCMRQQWIPGAPLQFTECLGTRLGNTVGLLEYTRVY